MYGVRRDELMSDVRCYVYFGKIDIMDAEEIKKRTTKFAIDIGKLTLQLERNDLIEITVIR